MSEDEWAEFERQIKARVKELTRKNIPEDEWLAFVRWLATRADELKRRGLG